MLWVDRMMEGWMCDGGMGWNDWKGGCEGW